MPASKTAFIMLSLLGIITALVGGCRKQPESEEVDRTSNPAPVIIAQVGYEIIQRPVIGKGIVHPIRQESLFFQRSGKVDSIYVIAGQRVKEGEVLASLHHSPESIRQQKKRNSQRLAQQRSETDESELFLLRAPFYGRILRLLWAEGDSVTAGQCVVILAEMDPFAVARVYLGEDNYFRLQPGDSAIVTPLNETPIPLHGTVAALGISDQTEEAPFWVEVRFENPGGMAPSGRSVNVRIISSHSEKAILIPTGALVDHHDNTASVFLITDKRQFAVRRHVELGPEINDRTIINKGLYGGETLVVYGQNRLSVGTRVYVVGGQK
ncbi:MAG: hypothetical protein ABH878_07345 [bacterium]